MPEHTPKGKAAAETMYKANEFATRASVTVRTLHHYDRLGLLKPVRGESGYRLYRDSDLDRLEQVLALKLLGIPLKQIKVVLDHGTRDLRETLRLQRTLWRKRQRMLGSAITAIEEAEQALASGRESKAAILRKVIEVINMQSNSDWMMKY